MTMHHTHHDYPGDTTGYSASMMIIVLTVIAAVVLLALAFAWMPWGSNNTTNSPGQGGSDTPAEEQVPAPSVPTVPEIPQEQR
jgi:hypothetical protein